MDPFPTRAAHAAAVFLEALILVWIGRKVAELVARRNFSTDLTTRDNPAAGIALGGFYAALFAALSGLLAGPAAPRLGHDLLYGALHGAVAIACLVLCASLWRPLLQVDFRKDVLEARNAGAAGVDAAALVATGLIYRGSLVSESGNWATVAAFFGIGEGALFLFLMLYEAVTPYDVYEEVGERRNPAAAISFAGAIVAAGIIIGNAVEGAFTTWVDSIRDTLLYLLPLAALPLVRWVVVNGLLLGCRGVDREVAGDRNAAAGAVEASAYVGVALFAVHLL